MKKEWTGRLEVKMKKANVLLTSLVLTIALILLGIFGTDMAYTVLARYKLQKVTESVAAECVSVLATSSDYQRMSDIEINNNIRDIVNQYKDIYKSAASDLNGLIIDRIEYKLIPDDPTTPDRDDSAVLKVSAEASVYPVFLRFVGVNGIKVYAISYAKTERKELSETMHLTDEGKHFVEFELSNNPITYKPRELRENDDTNHTRGDFAINFKYEPKLGNPYDENNQNGGYFIFGGYKSIDVTDNRYYWADIGYGATDENKKLPHNKYIVKKGSGASFIGPVGNVQYCINNADGEKITFNLDTAIKDDNEIPENWQPKGFTKKVDKIRIYHSLGVASETIPIHVHLPIPIPDLNLPLERNACWECPFRNNNICNIPIIADSIRDYMRAYTNRNANVTLTILNNVKLISKNDYNSADSTQRFVCRPENSSGSDIEVPCTQE